MPTRMVDESEEMLARWRASLTTRNVAILMQNSVPTRPVTVRVTPMQIVAVDTGQRFHRTTGREIGASGGFNELRPATEDRLHRIAETTRRRTLRTRCVNAPWKGLPIKVIERVCAVLDDFGVAR